MCSLTPAQTVFGPSQLVIPRASIGIGLLLLILDGLFIDLSVAYVQFAIAVWRV
jgi:hypothetical protein